MVYARNQNLAITLAAEGFAAITNFTSYPIIVHPGDSITFSFSLRNDGNTDNLFARILDIDTGTEVIPIYVFTSVATGQTVSYDPPSVIMPNKNWNLRLEAGHIEEPPSEDLIVSSVTIPPSVDYWETFNIECLINNNGPSILAYARLVDISLDYIINQTNMQMNNGLNTIIFQNIPIGCDNKNLRIECGRLT